MVPRYVVAVVLLCAGLLGAGVLATTAPSAAPGESPATSSELEGSFAVTERIVTDGVLFVDRTTVVDERLGTQRQTISFENFSTDTYWDESGDHYAKFSADSREGLSDTLENTSGEILERSADDHTAVVALDEPDSDRKPSESRYPDPLIASVYGNTAYDEAGVIGGDGTDAAETVTVYEPREGWVDGPSGLRYVTDADGELHVDDSDRLRYANVSLEAVDAETRWEYLLTRDDRDTLTMTYELEREPAGSTPDWLPENASESEVGYQGSFFRPSL